MSQTKFPRTLFAFLFVLPLASALAQANPPASLPDIQSIGALGTDLFLQSGSTGTRLGKAARGDVFALAKIAGHSSITITQKYVHPEEETIDEVFSRLTVGSTKKQVPTKVPTVKKKAANRLAAGIAK